jgi:hypothetical protein
MTDKDKPIILEMPEGITDEMLAHIRQQLDKVYEYNRTLFVCVPHGTKLATQQVEHRVGAEMDEALMALPRIATALENIDRHLGRLAKRFCPEP